MSYIHKALKKAQNEKDSLYRRYGGIISAQMAPERPGKKRLIVGVTAAAVFLIASTAFSLIALYRTDVPAPASPRTADPALYRGKIAVRDARAGGPAAPTDRTAAAEALYEAALRRHQKNDYAEAEALYKRAIDLAPDNLSAMNNLGVLYMRVGRHDEAVEIFNSLIAREGQFADPYYNLACLYALIGKPHRSVWCLKAAVSMNRQYRDWAKEDGDLESIRTLPEFKRIVGK